MPYKDPVKQKQAQHESYLRNRNKVYASSQRNKNALREEVRALKSIPCNDCGIKWPYFVMEFHHRNSAEKIDTVANLMRSSGREKVLQEIEKCDVICSNCHRIRTHAPLV